MPRYGVYLALDHMRRVLAIMLFAYIGAAASRPAIAHKASKQEILATVKHLSAEQCSLSRSGEQHIVGCDYSAAFIQGEWQVLVTYVLDEGGKHVRPSGGTIYILNAAGHVTKVLRGM